MFSPSFGSDPRDCRTPLLHEPPTRQARTAAFPWGTPGGSTTQHQQHIGSHHLHVRDATAHLPKWETATGMITPQPRTFGANAERANGGSGREGGANHQNHNTLSWHAQWHTPAAAPVPHAAVPESGGRLVFQRIPRHDGRAPKPTRRRTDCRQSSRSCEDGGVAAKAVSGGGSRGRSVDAWRDRSESLQPSALTFDATERSGGEDDQTTTSGSILPTPPLAPVSSVPDAFGAARRQLFIKHVMRRGSEEDSEDSDLDDSDLDDDDDGGFAGGVRLQRHAQQQHRRRAMALAAGSAVGSLVVQPPILHQQKRKGVHPLPGSHHFAGFGSSPESEADAPEGISPDSVLGLPAVGRRGGDAAHARPTVTAGAGKGAGSAARGAGAGDVPGHGHVSNKVNRVSLAMNSPGKQKQMQEIARAHETARRRALLGPVVASDATPEAQRRSCASGVDKRSDGRATGTASTAIPSPGSGDVAGVVTGRVGKLGESGSMPAAAGGVGVEVDSLSLPYLIHAPSAPSLVDLEDGGARHAADADSFSLPGALAPLEAPPKTCGAGITGTGEDRVAPSAPGARRGPTGKPAARTASRIQHLLTHGDEDSGGKPAELPLSRLEHRFATLDPFCDGGEGGRMPRRRSAPNLEQQPAWGRTDPSSERSSLPWAAATGDAAESMFSPPPRNSVSVLHASADVPFSPPPARRSLHARADSLSSPPAGLSFLVSARGDTASDRPLGVDARAGGGPDEDGGGVASMFSPPTGRQVRRKDQAWAGVGSWRGHVA